MKTSILKIKRVIKIKFILFFAYLSFFLFQLSTFAASKIEKENIKNITYTKSNSINVYTKDNCVEFIGNFKGTNKKKVLVADKVKIYYYSKKEKIKKNSSIKKFIAYGNVKITSEEKTAITEKAVYTDNDGLLVLTGKNTVVTSGNSTLKGEKIVYNTLTGKISMKNSPGKQINAVLDPKDRKKLDK